MPELPDLVYITEQLAAVLPGARIVEAAAGQPVVLRNTFDRLPGELLAGRSIDGVDYRGPFLRLALEGELELIFNLMLAGRLHLQRPGEREPGYRCLSLTLAGGLRRRSSSISGETSRRSPGTRKAKAANTASAARMSPAGSQVSRTDGEERTRMARPPRSRR